MDELMTGLTVNQFQYSGVSIDNLGSTEYTLVVTSLDSTGSVQSFESHINDAMKEVLGACKKHPRSENLLMRVTEFSAQSHKDGIREIHGFMTPSTVDESKYNISANGMTNLYDSTLEAIECTENYAKTLNDNDFFVNALVVICTDGEDNHSTIGTVTKIKSALDRLKTSEIVESVKVILIGINDAGCRSTLIRFKDDCGFDEYVSVENANASSLAKMAQFISQSISSSSQALGSGAPSQACNFSL